MIDGNGDEWGKFELLGADNVLRTHWRVSKSPENDGTELADAENIEGGIAEKPMRT